MTHPVCFNSKTQTQTWTRTQTQTHSSVFPAYMLLSDATQRRAISDANVNAYSVFYCSKKHWDLCNANVDPNADANAL